MRPWSTLAALLLWALAIGVALWRLARGRSVLGYGLLFFLLAHAVESTVIPLEIYFEHRNYLPAFGLYFALVLLMRRVVQSAAWASAPVMAGFAVWLTVAAMQTGVQASLWSREITLLRDALHTHPASVRANASLAAVYARMGDTDMARRYAERAATLDEPGHLRHGIRRLALLCIANAPLDPAVVQNLDRQLTSAALQDAGVSESLQVLVERSNREECPKLELGPVTAVFAQRLLSADPPAAAPKVYGLLAILENYLGHAAERDAYLARWLEREPDSVQAWMIQFTVATASADSRLREESLAELQRLERAGLVSREQSDDIELLRRDWPAGPRQDGGKLR
jgi:hypothetical protein